MKTLNFSILFVYLNFHKFPGSDFRVHWNALNSELGKMNAEISTFEQSGTRHKQSRNGRQNTIRNFYDVWHMCHIHMVTQIFLKIF